MNKRRKFGLYLVFLQVFFYFTAPCLAKTRVFWFKTERKGTDFISEHVTIPPLENGCFEYRSDTHTKLSVLAEEFCDFAATPHRTTFRQELLDTIVESMRKIYVF